MKRSSIRTRDNESTLPRNPLIQQRCAPGFHLIGDYPSDASGNAVTAGAVSPSFWTGVVHPGAPACRSATVTGGGAETDITGTYSGASSG